MSLTTSSSAPLANQSVTFTADVTPSYLEVGTPTGKVTFKDGTTILGSADLSGGTAKLTTHFSASSHKISAQYASHNNFNPHLSSTLTLVVKP